MQGKIMRAQKVVRVISRIQLRGCLFNKLISNFLFLLSFKWGTFSRRVTVLSNMDEQKINFGPIRNR